MNKKKLPVRQDESAARSLQDIFEIIKKNSPIQAKRVKDTLLLFARRLNDFPEKFSRAVYLADEPNNYRSLSKWSYKMIYEVTEDEIIIVMLFHGRQGQEVMERLKR